MFEQALAKTRDNLQTTFNSFAAERSAPISNCGRRFMAKNGQRRLAQ